MQRSLLPVLCSITVAAAAAAQVVVPEGAEPNDQNNRPTAMRCADQGEGEIFPAFDVDCWRFTLAAPADVTIAVGSRPQSVGIADPRLELLDGSLASIVVVDDTNDLFPVLQRTLAAGTYYVNVDAFGAGIGSYSLDVVCAPPGTGGSTCTGSPLPVFEGPEPNETTATIAGVMPCCSQVQGFADQYNSDLYGMLLTTETRVVFATGPGFVNPIDDTVLEIYASDGTTRLFYSDQSLENPYGYNFAYLDVTLPPGTYYPRVRGFGVSVGSYVVDVECRNDNVSEASYTTALGSGCPRTNGVVPTFVKRPNEVPLIGSVFGVDIIGLPDPPQPAFGIIGLTPLAQPLDLGLIGMQGCTLHANIDVSIPLVSAGGVAEFVLSVPGDPGIAGLQFRQQLILVDPGATALGLIVSDYGLAVVGNGY